MARRPPVCRCTHRSESRKETSNGTRADACEPRTDAHGGRAPAVTKHHSPRRLAHAFATALAVFALLTLSLGSALARSSIASQASLPAAREVEWTPTLGDVPFPRATE